ncbi:heterogeneous nuclear ribonucleoprotein 1-like [Silene latifolia]|uniref:heterogeneous nuclear ribonucleoprotein 1-like n=1 Tax=Silene latifolia TaxID=37657 RepID=UPI003D77DFD0
MDSEEAKLFVGGITWETTEDTLRDYFSKYGDVTNTAVMRDKTTGRPRGFAFVMFSDPSAIDSLLLDKHTIDGRLVEAKRALSREEQSSYRQDSSNGGRASGGGGNFKTKKIFVGGLPPTLTEEGFRQYFENFGQVTDAVIMFDQSTQRPRGFGFISFDTEDAVDRVLQKNFHDLNGKDVEVKRALPKDANSPSGNLGGGNQNYGPSRGNSGSYDNRMDGNRYMQPQTAGFSSYPGYNPAGYGGYGGPTGSYGGYGGYGGGAGAYAGQGGGYGGANAAGGGYGSGPANAMKAAYQSAGYGSSGYGAGYGPTAGYGSGTTGNAQTGLSTGGGPGYGNQSAAGYGAGGGYVGNGYGVVGGRAGSGPTGSADGGDQSGAGTGYMGSGYAENNRNPGYGAGSGYGGYGDAQSWQGQQ